MNQRDDQDLQERIRTRAYRLWEQEGRPQGRADAHWDMAAELTAIEENQRLATKPAPSASAIGPTGEPVEPLLAAENFGDTPTLTDQGEERTYPGRAETPAIEPIDTDAEAARANAKSERSPPQTPAKPAASRATALSAGQSQER